MFNIGPGEIIIVALVLLMAVGPEQLPGVIRRVGRTVSQVRSMTEGLRSDFMAGMDEIERATDPNAWAGSAGPSSEDKPPKKHSAVMTATEANEEAAEGDSASDETASDDSASDSDSDDSDSASDEGDSSASDADDSDSDSDSASASASDSDDSDSASDEGDSSASDADDSDSNSDETASDDTVESTDKPSTNGAAVRSASNGNGTQPSDPSTEAGEELTEDGTDKTDEEEQA